MALYPLLYALLILSVLSSTGVKATYLLAVAFLEIIRFSSNGGMLNGSPNSTASRSAFSCVFEYLKSPNLMPAVSQCLTAIVHRAFETAILWLVCSLSPPIWVLSTIYFFVYISLFNFLIFKLIYL